MKKKIGLTLALSCALAISAVGCSQTKDESKETKEYTFATAPDTQPFTYKEGNKLTGFDIELVEQIAKNEDLNVKWKEMKFDGIIGSLKAKTVDGAVAAITINDKRKKSTDFTDVYYESGLVLVTKKDTDIKDLKDLKGKSIAAKKGSAGAVLAQEYATKYGATAKVYDDEPSLYLSVLNGNTQVMINDLPFVQAKLKTEKFSKLAILGDKKTVDNYGIAIAKDEPELLKAFNKELKEMRKNGEYNKLYKKYFGE